jgi:hypothetical protein
LSKKILLISSGQPSLNPRLVKEADALTNTGYKVTVLYAYWNSWGTQHDRELLAKKKWKAIRAGGDPEQRRLIWFLSRLIQRTAQFLLRNTRCYPCLAELAISRGERFLVIEAKKHEADLYIAHNLGALPAAVKAGKRYKKPVGFDAEDFHRQEATDDMTSYSFKVAKYIEDKYLPQADYITASSPLIAERYSSLYKRKVISILNVFPKTEDISIRNDNVRLKLFWFSQVIGPSRGLELIVEAMRLATAKTELHLLGKIEDSYRQNLSDLSNITDDDEKLFFYEPIMADSIFRFATQFDIGLASETGFCLNNNLALSNKLFTYIQSGLAIAVSNTPAQAAFIDQYPQTGKVYRNANELASILSVYSEERELLLQTKKESVQIGQVRLNWEVERCAFLKVVEDILTLN